jgi:hypothetical protein
MVIMMSICQLIVSQLAGGVLTFIGMFIPRLIIMNDFYINRTTDLIKKHGVISFSIEVNRFAMAGYGLHIVRLGYIFYIVYKDVHTPTNHSESTESYYVYGLFLMKFYNEISNKGYDLCYHVEKFTDYQIMLFPIMCDKIKKPYSYQHTISKQLIKRLNKNNRVSIIVSGKSGVGKSSLVFIIHFK